MKLMEGEYNIEKFKKIMGGAYGIEYYGEEDMQRKTDVREVARGVSKGVQGGDYYDNPIAAETANLEHENMYDKYDKKEMGEGGGEDEEEGGGATGRYTDKEEN